MTDIAGLEAINGILWGDWNPIGFPVPRDEYVSYARELHSMLSLAAGDDEILAYLHWAEGQNMGLGGERADADVRNLPVLLKLRSLSVR